MPDSFVRYPNPLVAGVILLSAAGPRKQRRGRFGFFLYRLWLFREQAAFRCHSWVLPPEGSGIEHLNRGITG